MTFFGQVISSEAAISSLLCFWGTGITRFLFVASVLVVGIGLLLYFSVG